MLRYSLPVSLTLARLRRAAALLTRLEFAGTLHATMATDDAAKAFTLRLERAVDDLETMLAEIGTAGR